MSELNIEHPTSNAEHRTCGQNVVPNFDVRCSMFCVSGFRAILHIDNLGENDHSHLRRSKHLEKYLWPKLNYSKGRWTCSFSRHSRASRCTVGRLPSGF